MGRDAHRRAARNGAAPGVLDPYAERTVTAAAEGIIPATDTPGATDAGVTAFVDRMLSDWHTPDERERVLNGLRALDARSRERHGRDFADCAAPDQAAMLAALDDEVTALRRRDDPAADEHWFARFKFLTAFGYCTSEVAMHRTLRIYPLPTRYDGCAPIGPA